ncbi:putative cytochrome-c oxidase (mitochondrion) [Rosa chinensis]|uniref:Cytochrome c oxidase subunit 2 n=1 Tax=Rosa chinensis TaxID=74649 RepID=A0A2P6P0Z3_ROSCH|nr:putative cytochrome-c oxidase [Rosa chinensis]
MIVKVLEWIFLTIAPCDAAEPWQLGFQDAATPMMQGIMDLHHDIFFFLILILVFVSRILVRALWHFHYKKNPIPQRIVHGTTIEILRTIFPSIIPMFIAIPSFALLYSMDEVVVDPAITIKAIEHQWYRTYEYSDYNSSDEQSRTFDSYTIPEDDLELGQSRLLEVDNRVVVPAKTHLRIIVTPADVPHTSYAVPLVPSPHEPPFRVGWTGLPNPLNEPSPFSGCPLAISEASTSEPIILEVSGVGQDELWAALEAAELRKLEADKLRLSKLMNSPEYLETEEELFRFYKQQKAMAEEVAPLLKELGYGAIPPKEIRLAVDMATYDMGERLGNDRAERMAHALRVIADPNSQCFINILDELRKLGSIR